MWDHRSLSRDWSCAPSLEVRSLKYWITREVPQHYFSCHYKIYIYIHMYVCVFSCFSHAWLFATLWTVTRHSSLSIWFFRQEYCSGLPCPPPGGLPDPEMEPASLRSSALAGGTFTARAIIYTQPKKKQTMICYWWNVIWYHKWSYVNFRMSLNVYEMC